MDHSQIKTNGIHLHVAQAGPKDGPLVILLHGFPEFWYGWRHQISFLADAGYRVWAPDQRGYNLSEKPDRIADYRIDALAADVIGLIDAAGRKKAFLIGHDWGAAVAWFIARTDPERLKRMVILNVPHGAVMQTHLRRNPAQRRRSWYIYFFQIPWLPEMLSRLGNWAPIARTLIRSSRPGTFSRKELAVYRRAWSQPKAFRSMVNWYRAVVQQPPAPPENKRVSVPTLLIWGVHDLFLGREMAQPSINLCDDGRLVFFEEATHWVQHEEGEGVNSLIGKFLKSD